MQTAVFCLDFFLYWRSRSDVSDFLSIKKSGVHFVVGVKFRVRVWFGVGVGVVVQFGIRDVAKL